MGDCLRADAANPVGPWAAFIGRPYFWQAWTLLHGVRTGENAFRHVHGTDVSVISRGACEEGAIFDRAMTAISRGIIDAVVRSYNFGPFPCVVDVGGGQGALLAGILRCYTATRGILFDQPHVVAGAERSCCGRRAWPSAARWSAAASSSAYPRAATPIC